MRLHLWSYTLCSVELFHLNKEGTDVILVGVRHSSERKGLINQKCLLFVFKMLKSYFIHWKGLHRSQPLVEVRQSLEHSNKGRIADQWPRINKQTDVSEDGGFWRPNSCPYKYPCHPEHHKDTDPECISAIVPPGGPDAAPWAWVKLSGAWCGVVKGVLSADPPKSVCFLASGSKQNWPFELKVQFGDLGGSENLGGIRLLFMCKESVG